MGFMTASASKDYIHYYGSQQSAIDAVTRDLEQATKAAETGHLP